MTEIVLLLHRGTIQSEQSYCFAFLNVLSVYALVSLFGIHCSKGEPVKRIAKYRFQKISQSPNSTIISHTFTADTRRKCVHDCTEKSSPSLYYLKSTRICHCNQNVDSIIGPGAGDAFYGEVESFMEESEDGCNTYVTPAVRDCLELYQNGAREDGVYTIQPVGGATVNTWCDMTNGGWTVFQRRQDGSENFFRNWDDYVTGFGDKCGEYWLGLDNIHLLVKEPSELYISLVTFGDVTPPSAYAYYSTFSIGDSSTNYRLSVGGFDGDCGDGFGWQSGNMFTTKDNDNDVYSGGNCAISYKGGWWYRDCHCSNLNALYLRGAHASFADGINWYYCWDLYYSLKETVMKLRRL